MAAEAISKMLANPDLLSDPTFLVAAGAITLSAVALTCLCLPSGSKKPEEVKEEEPKLKGKTKVVETRKTKKVEKEKEKEKEKPKVVTVDHPLWISSTSTGGEISGFSYNGRDLCAVTSNDYTFKIFDPKHQEKLITKVKDNATVVAMNDTHLIAFISFTDSFAVYKLNPGPGVKPEFVADFPKDKAEKHKKEVISLELAKNGKFFVTSSDDTLVKVWTTTGSLLGEFNTNQMVNKMLRISPDSRFISVAAFTSEVKIWEVCYKKSGSFDSITKAMALRGHKTAINCLCFSSDSTRIYTGAKDGIWRVFRINVRYHLNEDPVLEKEVATGTPITMMEISPDGKLLAIIDKRKVQFWNVEAGNVTYELDFSKLIVNCGEVRWFVWSEDSKRFATVIGQYVFFWHSPTAKK